MAESPLLSVEEVSMTFGPKPLFENLRFILSEGDRVGLIGPNGAGKSTFMRILAGQLIPDTGKRVLRGGIQVGFVPQKTSFPPGLTVEEVVVSALAEHTNLEEYERFSRAAQALGKAGFKDRSQGHETLSGGWQKRLSIAVALAREPDVLLLDEPTNHLDTDSILWLESLLLNESKAFVVISHDRYFLENVATRMVEIDRVYSEGILESVGPYSRFLEIRDDRLQNQAAYRSTLANLVRREIEWLRRGPKARTTKSKSRIQSAEKKISKLADLKDRMAVSSASIEFSGSNRRTKRLWEAKNLSKSWGDRPILTDLNLLLSPGNRLGLVGPNGSGKTTVLRLIASEIEASSGTIRQADRLRVVYFEQSRESLDETVTLKRALAPEGDSVVYRDREVHVASWAQRFLFRTEQLDTPVSRLSGGERARIIIARLMLRPADLLILDEPTNDLDISTLEVLEDSLLDFPGALVLVTHDRFLLDRVTNRLLALDGSGTAEFFADRTQWRRAQHQTKKAAQPSKVRPSVSPKKMASTKKLSYLEQREFDAMEERVLEAEERLENLKEQVQDPTIATDAAALIAVSQELQAAEAEVETLYARWEELEGKVG